MVGVSLPEGPDVVSQPLVDVALDIPLPVLLFLVRRSSAEFLLQDVPQDVRVDANAGQRRSLSRLVGGEPLEELVLDPVGVVPDGQLLARLHPFDGLSHSDQLG